MSEEVAYLVDVGSLKLLPAKLKNIKDIDERYKEVALYCFLVSAFRPLLVLDVDTAAK